MNFPEKAGSYITARASALARMFVFAGKVFRRLLAPATRNSATRTVLINQIYFTAAQILPAFPVVSALFGFLFTGVAFQALKNLGLVSLFGNVSIGMIVTELSPFFTILLVTLRSDAAINAEMAAMQANREIKALEAFSIDIIDCLLAPRVVGGMISVVLLSFLFSIALMASGILFSLVIFGISADIYVNILLNSTNFSDIVVALLKCAVFVFFITMMPVYSGLQATHELTSIPNCCLPRHGQSICGDSCYRGAVVTDKITLTLFADGEALGKAMHKFMRMHQLQAAPISADIPLISSLETWLNIALIKQYHETLPAETARKMAVDLLRDLGLEKVADKRNPALGNEGRFYVKLLRAAVVEKAAIVIDRPFAMLPQEKNFSAVAAALKKIKNLYISCDIYDYGWMADKYGALCR